MIRTLSGELFEKLVSAIDIDDVRCTGLVQQLLSNQPSELLKYRKLARCGMKAPGKLGAVSAQLHARLDK
jgi:hypothetical protein